MSKKTIFITGATSGIGRLIAELCLKKGHSVYVTGRNKEALISLSEIGCETIEADLNNIEEIQRLCETLPNVDVAILNAGVGFFRNAYDLEDFEIENMININIKAPIILSKYIAKKMIEQNQGHIIFIGSQAGKVPTKKASVYAATKHAMTGFINGLRMELKRYNIKITGVYPGPIDTPFIDKADYTGTYRKSMDKYLLNPQKVAEKVVQAIDKPKRELNLPPYMSITSRLYAIAPKLTEKLGKSFFEKK